MLNLSSANPEQEAPRTRGSAGDGSWKQFYEAHFDLVYRMICRSGVPLSEVEDLTQRTFMLAHEKFQDLSEIEYPRAWLRAVALRVVAENRRRRRYRDWKHKVFFLANDPHPERPSPEQLTEAARAQLLVGKILDRMPEKLREVLVLTDIEQCRPQEVSEVLGIPVNTVRSRRRLARELFKKWWRRLAPEGGTYG